MLCAAAGLGSAAAAGGSWPELPFWQPSRLLSDPLAAAPVVRPEISESGEKKKEH